MTIVSSETLHSSCIAIGAHAVLIEGRSGMGKSDLALRLIDRGAQLVSDDYTVLQRAGKALIATPPATIAGKIEVRGLGIIEMPFVDRVPVALLIVLVDDPERMPPDLQTRKIAGVELPVISIAGHDASAPIKVELALKRLDLTRK